MIQKEIRTDLLWVFGTGALTFLFIGLSVGFEDWGTKPFEIQLHDTYFVFSIWQVYLWIFFNLAFWTFLIKEANNKFKRNSSNFILLVQLGLLILITSLIMKHIEANHMGWIIYPHWINPK